MIEMTVSLHKSLPSDFDHEDLLDENGFVTIVAQPSNWHRYNLSPDTYQLFNGDSWLDYTQSYFNELENLGEAFGEEYTGHVTPENGWSYDDFTWSYDHSAIVRELAQELADWMAETLWYAGLDSVSVKLRDTWSPKFYNFQSDGFEVEITCDPGELRTLTPDFDVDAWGYEHYRSYDGFMSFVTSRLNDDDWHADYDGQFRIESLLATYTDSDYRFGDTADWRYRLWEREDEIYTNNVTITPRPLEED